MKPLSVGNIVSAGLRIYRDRFKDYYQIAFIGTLWYWIPIYGWAKFFANMGLISRLAYKEVSGNPESVRDGRRYIKSKMWNFLGAGILVGLRFLGAYLLWLVFFLLMVLAIGFVSNGIGGANNNTIGAILGIIVALITFVSFLCLIIWLVARYLIVDLPLAVETDTNVSGAIKRSVELTKGQIARIYLVVTIAILISIPLYTVAILLQIIPNFINQLDIGALRPLVSILSLIVSSATSAFIVPMWQSIKAVIYYDLLVRKEGLGLDLESESDFS